MNSLLRAVAIESRTACQHTADVLQPGFDVLNKVMVQTQTVRLHEFHLLITFVEIGLNNWRTFVCNDDVPRRRHITFRVRPHRRVLFAKSLQHKAELLSLLWRNPIALCRVNERHLGDETLACGCVYDDAQSIKSICLAMCALQTALINNTRQCRSRHHRSDHSLCFV